MHHGIVCAVREHILGRLPHGLDRGAGQSLCFSLIEYSIRLKLLAQGLCYPIDHPRHEDASFNSRRAVLNMALQIA
jgi:hypothetical protein